MLAEMRRGKQLINNPLIHLNSRRIGKLFRDLWRGRQAGQIQKDAADESIQRRLGCRPQARQEQQPYPLPADVRQPLKTLASECDVLVFGETHGTKEVPAIVEDLLDILTKLEYRALALEVSRDQQPEIAADLFEKAPSILFS